MPVSGLVVSFDDDATADLMGRLIAMDRAFKIGERVGPRLALAAVAPDGRAAERQHEWLRRLPGVVKVDVAFVCLDATEEVADAN